MQMKTPLWSHNYYSECYSVVNQLYYTGFPEIDFTTRQQCIML